MYIHISYNIRINECERAFYCHYLWVDLFNKQKKRRRISRCAIKKKKKKKVTHGKEWSMVMMQPNTKDA